VRFLSLVSAAAGSPDRGKSGMVVQTFGMAFPTRSETEAVLTSLADGTLTASEANDWACPFVVEEATHPARMDRVVWNALTTLCGADLESAPGVLLHGSEDFAGWLAQFRRDAQAIPV
jgi:hypothetical protein